MMNIRKMRRMRKRNKKTTLVMGFFLLLAALCIFGPIAGATLTKDNGPAETIIGIDLGTTYSCVGVYRNGNTEIIANDQGNRITPSYVAFTEGERLVGDAAKNQASLNPTNTIFDAKRLIGRKYHDHSVQADRKLVPFEIIPGSGGKPLIQVHPDGTTSTDFAPEEISAMVLQKMKTTAEAYLGHEVKRAVVTVPAYFNDAQRAATKDAATIAGLQVDRILNEPTAAALAYGLNKGGHTEGDRTVLVYDLGGGTFDVTLLNIDDGMFEVLSTSGDTHLGGEDFDQRVMQYYIKMVQKKSGNDISSNHRALQKLRKEVERVKRTLSSQSQARVEIDDLIPGYDLSDTLTRARFEELNNDLFRKTLGPVKDVLKTKGMTKSDIDEIVLVGGSTRIPKIQQLLSEFFDGKEVSTQINPDEAVGIGAAIQGAILGGYFDNHDVILLDVTPLSLGIETVGGVMTNVVDKGERVPTKKSKTFSTHSDNQSTVSIVVFEGERSMTKDNHLLGKFDLTGIAPAPRGVPQIEVTFKVDANNILQVSAQDKGTGRAETITIAADQDRLSQAEIDRMVEEAARFAEEDRLTKERIDAKNGLESVCYNLKNTIGDQTVSLSSEDIKDASDVIDETLDWLDENPEARAEDYQAKQKEVEQVTHPIMRKLYENASGGDYDDVSDFDDGDL